MRSACRGEARKTSIPKRARSKLAAPAAIISMAQQASPKVAGHTLFLRAHLTRSSTVPVRKLWLRSSRPISAPSGDLGDGQGESRAPLGRTTTQQGWGPLRGDGRRERWSWPAWPRQGLPEGALRGFFRFGRARHSPHRRFRRAPGAEAEARETAPRRPPVERAVADEVDERHEHSHREDHHLDQTEQL